MDPRTFRRAATLILLVGVLLIGLMVVVHFGAGDSSDPNRAAGTTTIGTSPTTVRITTTTKATATTRGVEHRDLLDALQSGLVEAEFRSTGGASGDIIKLSIRLVEARDQVLSLSVPTGMMLSNPSGGEQDLVIRGLEGRMTGEFTYVEATEIELPDLDWQEYLLEAYCSEAHDANPSEGGVLTAADLAGEDLTRVLAAIDDAGAGGDIRVIQAVVWAVTDDVDMADLNAIGYGLDASDLALARTVIEQAGLDPGTFRLFG